MTDATRAFELDRLLARDAIRDVLSRYARGIDRADTALLKGCYFDDAIEEHGSSFSGRAHDYVDAAMPKVKGMGVMQHLLGNSYIDLDGEVQIDDIGEHQLSHEPGCATDCARASV